MRRSLFPLVCVLGLTLGSSAYALPFEATPSGFTRWFNSRKGWKGGAQKVTLSYPRECDFTSAYGSIPGVGWGCRGYLKVVDPTGTTVCDGKAYYDSSDGSIGWKCSRRGLYPGFGFPSTGGGTGRRSNPQ